MILLPLFRAVVKFCSTNRLFKYFLNPFLHVQYLVLVFEDHGNSLFYILSPLILAQIYPKDWLNLFLTFQITSR